ncbi:helix-turn-helix domain-containing protein [Anaerosporobacter sp.]|uniref:helix-turn-helix domain-containing protein n=1 Tax=Anaerosporobacter sp. TaxID=1872529 RepID=UPI00286ED410|nr:helix-turn-helix transcriptional regulator [Anaerosporobacter sp.]
MNIGKRLARQRKKHGYTQKQLAAELNLSQQIISNIERDLSAPDIGFLKGAADLYKMTIDELVGRENTYETKDSIEKQILDVVKEMDGYGKELSLGLLNQVAEHRKNKKDTKK